MKRLNIVGFRLASILLVIFVVFMTMNITGCREAITYDNDIEFTFWQCDTLTKYNPAKDEWKCWVRCRDTAGYEYSHDIDCQ